jgi:hypothetical protein
MDVHTITAIKLKAIMRMQKAKKNPITEQTVEPWTTPLIGFRMRRFIAMYAIT